MKKLLVFLMVLGLVIGVSGLAQATNTYVWNFTNAGDYVVGGDSGTPPLGISYLPVITQGTPGSAYFPARPYINADDDPPYGSDWASLFAKINTQAPGLRVGDITGGGYTINSFASVDGTPSSIYGSLYLSPTGGSGSDVLILLSPMSITGTGILDYTFDLTTHADYRTMGVGGWTSYDPLKSGTFGDVIGMINSSSYSSDYAAFFGPQIGMSNTSGTTFTLTQIDLNTVPEPATMLLLGLGLVGLAGIRRKFKG